MVFLFFVCLFFFKGVMGVEFVYPVLAVGDDSLLLVQQKSLDCLRLWLYDLSSGVVVKELSDQYFPFGVSLLPNEEGFSFIDRGKVRVKKFARRSPRSIDITEPINSITSVVWLDEDSFYFEGKVSGFHGFFVCDLSDGQAVYTLAYQKELDFLYPYKFKDKVYCFLRSTLDCKLIVFDWRLSPYSRAGNQVFFQELLTVEKGACFLKMINDEVGFFLKSVPSADSSVLRFSCCFISLLNGSWSQQDLFSFGLPISMLVGDSEDRLYESIFPLLPKFLSHKNLFYFFDYSIQDQSVCLYTYNLLKDETTLQSIDNLVSACYLNDKIYCGKIQNSLEDNNFKIKEYTL